jgi:hypothetical protein
MGLARPAFRQTALSGLMTPSGQRPVTTRGATMNSAKHFEVRKASPGPGPLLRPRPVVAGQFYGRPAPAQAFPRAVEAGGTLLFLDFVCSDSHRPLGGLDQTQDR